MSDTPKTLDLTMQSEYLQCISELEEFSKNAPYVTHRDIVEITQMTRQQLQKIAIVSRDWHSHFAHSLDNIPEIRNIQGAAPDGCWSHKEVRAVVISLLNVIEKYSNEIAK